MLKKILNEYQKDERTFKIEVGIKNLRNEIVSNEKIKKYIVNELSHDSKNGKTIVFIMNYGLLELHEILSKNVIYMHLSIRNKKVFDKIMKELDGE